MRALRALVTGAAGAVGGAIAAHLATAGHRVVKTDLVAAEELIVGDVSEPDDVERICVAAEQQMGGVDVLVNAAGRYGERVPFSATDPAHWWRVLETNLRGPAMLCRRLVPSMVQRGFGYVIDVNSKAAVWDDPGQNSVAYSTSKAALARFSSSLANELRGTGVVVVDASPGMVRSGMTATRPDFDDIPEHRFLPSSAIGEMVTALVSGGYDDLHGHFLHAADDLDAMLQRVQADPRVRTPSLGPYGPDDPVA